MHKFDPAVMHPEREFGRPALLFTIAISVFIATLILTYIGWMLR